MMPGNVFADVGGAVQQQAVADDDERGLDVERAVVLFRFTHTLVRTLFFVACASISPSCNSRWFQFRKIFHQLNVARKMKTMFCRSFV